MASPLLLNSALSRYALCASLRLHPPSSPTGRGGLRRPQQICLSDLWASIRHCRLAALPLAMLCASLGLHLPVSATGGGRFRPPAGFGLRPHPPGKPADSGIPCRKGQSGVTRSCVIGWPCDRDDSSAYGLICRINQDIAIRSAVTPSYLSHSSFLYFAKPLKQ